MRKEHVFLDRGIPEYFKPILWSYDMSHMDLRKAKRTIIIHAINYGDIKHWRWIMHYYGKDRVREVLETVPATSFRPHVQKLAALVFGVKKFNYALRSAS